MNTSLLVLLRGIVVLITTCLPVLASINVIWTPKSSSTQLFRGTSQTFNASLTTSTTLTNVDLIVVPALQPFITVTPNHFSVLQQSIPTSIVVTISAAESSAIGLYTGTIQLRSHSSLNAFPLPLVLSLDVVPTSSVVPPGLSLPSADRIITDPGTDLIFARDELLVTADPSATPQQIAQIATGIGATFLGSDADLHVYQLFASLPTLSDVMTAMAQLATSPVIRFSVPHFIGSASNTIPDDPSWGAILRPFESWAQDLIGLPGAWTVTTGSTGQKIAFVDVAFDINHEDLLIDALRSDLTFNFPFPNHGTEVVSVASAIGNNARGLAGAMWASDAFIFSCSSNNNDYVSFPVCRTLAKEAINRGARVVNISLSLDFSQTCNPSKSPDQLQVLLDAEKQAWSDVLLYGSNQPAPVLFVLAAGNDRILYNTAVPATLSTGFANTVSVAAVDRHAQQASYSNFGNVSLWAPGGDQPSGMCPNNQRLSPFPPSELIFYPATNIWVAHAYSTYGYASGTSLAAPFVSGVAGLLLSVKSNLDGQQLKNILVSTARDTGNVDLSGNPIKVLDAFNAVQQALAPPAPTFMKTLGTSLDDYASSIQPTSDGGFIVGGYTRGTGVGREDLLLVKIDSSGSMTWAKTAGTTGSDIAYSIRQTSDGGYVIGGSTDGPTGVAQMMLSKFDNAGEVQWTSTLGNTSDSAASFSAQQTTDGGYLETGFPGGANWGLGLLKYSSTGQLQWISRVPGPNHYGLSVQQTSDGGYIVAGNIQIGGSQYDVSLLKFDSSGALQWAQQAGGAADESANSVQQTSDGGYIVAGTTASYGAGGQDVFLLKYDGTGSLTWAQTEGGTGNDIGDSVRQTSDGGYIVSGRTTSFGTGAQNVLLLKFDSSGTLQWARTGGGSTSSTSVQQTSDGGYFVAGSTANFGAGGSDFLLIRTDANGNIAGCADWSSVTPTPGISFQSSATTYTIDPQNYFATGAPTLIGNTATLTPNTRCGQ